MIDINDFLKFLRRQKLVLLLFPLLTAIVTFLFVRKLPGTYVSKARIATGIVDESQQILNPYQNIQEIKINQQFTNIIQVMLLKKIINQVSYKLMLHDLIDPKPFRKPSKLLNQLNSTARQHAIEVYTSKSDSMAELSLWNPDQNGLYEVLKSMKYDDRSLNAKLSIYRIDNSDFIDVQFESENAELSAFVVNTLCQIFIDYYTSLLKENQSKAIAFLAELLQQKRNMLREKIEDLKEYKTKNRVLTLVEQAKSLFGQIADFETRKQTAEKEIISYTAALQSINNKFNPRDRKYFESALTQINQNIVQTKEQLKWYDQMYVTSNFDERYKRKIDSLKQILVSQINLSTDEHIFNPMIAKQDLIAKKLNMEVSLDLARNSVSSLNAELVRLNNKFDKLVPHEAVIQGDEIAIDIASREYLEVLTKYNQTSMAASYSIKLRQIEMGVPGSLQPSKKMILVILSAILSIVFSIMVLFVLYYLDDSIKTAEQLVNKTDTSVLEYLPLLKIITIANLKEIWLGRMVSDNNDALQRYKDLLRSLRYETEKKMESSKCLVITSSKSGEGKSFVSLSLAYAYAMANKKVLLIDGNFEDPLISMVTHSTFYLEDYFNNQLQVEQLRSENGLTVLANKGGDNSLFELSDRFVVKQRMQILRNTFDIVLIEAPALDALNKSKEWIESADKVLSVYEARKAYSAERKEQVNFLKNLDNKFVGWVFNKIILDKKVSRKLSKKVR